MKKVFATIWLGILGVLAVWFIGKLIVLCILMTVKYNQWGYMVILLSPLLVILTVWSIAKLKEGA